MFDILILSAEKDFNKIKFVYESINEHIQDFDQIYCITNKKIDDELKIQNIQYYTDGEILDFDFSKFKGNVLKRSGWYRQQYIKLFQNITSDDYLIVDSDILFNRQLEIVSDDKPNFFFGRNQYNEAYFRFMKTLLDLDRAYEHSFINEIMYFRRENIQHMLDILNVNLYEFFDKSVEILNKMNHDAGLSEYELYGNFVTKYFPNSYNYKGLNTHLGGKYSAWSDQEIIDYKNYHKNDNYDIISMHSWM
jgi:predicted DNA-binding transcriptional regulator AlpA